MNVQDALGTVAADIEKTKEIIQTTEETRTFLVETHAYLAEKLGTGNEEVGKFGLAIEKVAELQQDLNQSLSDQEELHSILGSIL